MDMGENTVQFIEAMVGDDQRAFAARALPDRDLSAQLLRQLLLEAAHIGIGTASGGGRDGRAQHAPNQRLGLAHREPLRHHLGGRLTLFGTLGEAEQRARMTHLDLAPFDQLADLGGQLQQSQQVADPGARAPDRLGRLRMREIELADQPLQRAPPRAD